jgi:ferric-dicitrate binding protein FerR (iron transport regulator)
LAAAATVALFLGGGIVWQTLPPAMPHPQEFVAPAGSPRTITLSDGSTVTLAPGSRLAFAEGRGASSSRSATLGGQAFFVVAHDARRPFLVTAGSVTTRVLGTEFNVRAYPEDRSTLVVLRSGKIRVTVPRAAGTSEAVLAPGEEARIDSLGRLQVDAADIGRTLGWTSGRLEFAGTELTAVLRDINRWYGLRLALADTSFARHRITATFDRTVADSAIATLTRLLGPGVLTSPSQTGLRR